MCSIFRQNPNEETTECQAHGRLEDSDEYELKFASYTSPCSHVWQQDRYVKAFQVAQHPLALLSLLMVSGWALT